MAAAPLLLLATLVPSALARAVELTADNFDRLVHQRKGQAGPAFVKFYAPWCQHCQALAANWSKLEKVYSSLDSPLLVGSVDCSDGPAQQPGQGGQNPLCTKFKAHSLPTLMTFHPPSKKGMYYEGNRSAEELLAFAGEISSACSPSALDACTDEQRELFARHEATTVKDLQERSSELSMGAESARMQMMMSQMQMQQTFGDKKLSKKKKDKKMAEHEKAAKSAQEAVEVSWAQSGELRAVQLLLRARSKDNEWAKVHEFEDEYEDMMPMGGGMGGRHGGDPAARETPPPSKPMPKPKPPPKRPAFDGPCVDAGPWPCHEAGCPAPQVGCKDLADDCKRKFSTVFSDAPEGVGAKTRVWEKCPRTCKACGGKEEL